MELNKLYVTKTGEAMRVVKLDPKWIHLALFEGDYVLNGALDKFQELMKAAEFKEIDEDEYKLRVVAMRMFQEFKNDEDYPHKTYLEEYEEMKPMMPQPALDGFFNAGGGYKEYDKL